MSVLNDGSAGETKGLGKKNRKATVLNSFDTIKQWIQNHT